MYRELQLLTSRVLQESVSKSQFISSISHELRSPLHGALASCELLGETVLDGHQTGLLEAISGCSRTLLVRRRRRRRRCRHGRRHSRTIGHG